MRPCHSTSLRRPSSVAHRSDRLPFWRSLRFLALCLPALVLSGCKTYQNVRPHFDSAISNLKLAGQMDATAIEADKNQQLRIIDETFAQLEASVLESLRVSLRSGYNPAKGDFNNTALWNGWFGEPDSEKIAADARARQRMALATSLTYSFEVVAGTPTPAYDVFASHRGDFRKIDSSLSDAQLEPLQRDYKAWLANFESRVLGAAPVMEKLREAHAAAVTRTNNESARRKQRQDALYAALIDVTETARDQAGALTDNAAVIAFAAKLAQLANAAVSHALPSFGTSPVTSSESK